MQTVTIQWFPGHMAKARREMAESLKRVDAVLELVDARLPEASRNPMLGELIQGKPEVIVMTRVDMADPHQTSRWREHFLRQGLTVVEVDAKSGSGVHRIVGALESATKERRERDARRGIRPRPIRTMVVGIPNVGKSSLINRLAGKSVAKTGDRPGITQTQQWIRLGPVELLDTPGVLWPKFDDQQTAYALAMSGAIKSEILDLSDICSYFLIWCSLHYPRLLQDKYGLEDLPAVEWTSSSEAWEAVQPTLEQIARRRGFMAAGGHPNLDRACETILREAQTGVLGRLSFEWDMATGAGSVEDPGNE